MQLTREQIRETLKSTRRELENRGAIGPKSADDTMAPVRCARCFTGTLEVPRAEVNTVSRVCDNCKHGEETQ